MALTTEKKITVPWVKQQPHLETGWTEATRLLAEGMPDYYGGSTVARLAGAQKEANLGIMGYTRSDRVKKMQRESQRQLGRGYQQSQSVFDRSLATAGRAENAGVAAWRDAQQRANKLGAYGQRGMNYGQGAMKTMDQGQYAGLTPFQDEQLSGMLAGKVNTDQLGAVTKAMGRDIMGTLSDPGGILSRIRQQTTQFQPGGGSRTDMVAGLAGKEATQRLIDQSSRMYADAYSQAQERRLPAGQLALGAQQQAQQLGMQGGQLGLGAGGLAQQGYGSRQQGYGTALQGMGAATAGGQLGLQTLSQYPTVMNAPLSMYAAQSGVGAQRRALNQADINAKMKKYEYGAMGDRNALAAYMPMISGDYGSASTTRPSGLQNMGSIAKLLGGLGGMFGAGGIFS
jgi:hypothetical protein